MLCSLLWWCLVVSMYRPVPGITIPPPGVMKAAAVTTLTCHFHIIFCLLRCSCSQDTLEQTWLPMIGLRMAPWLACSILNHYDHWLLEGFNLYILVEFGTPCSILKPILTVLLDLIMAHTCLGSLLRWSLIQIQAGSWKLWVWDDCVLQWNWSGLLSAMESEAEWICV